MKNSQIIFLLLILVSCASGSLVSDISSCWTAQCSTEYQACSQDPQCENAWKYMNLCEQKENCNLNPTDTWNETCWEYCNYDATPATVEKTWLTFEKCHLNSCKPTNSFLEASF